ncbi:MAG: hypothetical protein R3D00_07570 [Bacteroidia bacterium]
MTALKSIASVVLLILTATYMFAGPVAKSPAIDAQQTSAKSSLTDISNHSAAEMITSDKVIAHSEKEKTAPAQKSGTQKAGMLILIFSVAGVFLFPAVMEFVASESIKRSLFSRG